MEEVWLQTRKKSEREEKWLAELQRIQGGIWRALRIAESQRVYTNAKATLPGRARAVLDPFEELPSKMLLADRLTTSLIKDIFLTTSFVFSFRAGSREE
jgi:hypothetical protein